MKPRLSHLSFHDLFQFGISLANPSGATGTRACLLIAVFGASRVTLSADTTNEFDATLERLVCASDGTKLLPESIVPRVLEHLATLRTLLPGLGDLPAVFFARAKARAVIARVRRSRHELRPTMAAGPRPLFPKEFMLPPATTCAATEAKPVLVPRF